MRDRIFYCCLCKKHKNQINLESVFANGDFLCKQCSDEIKGAFKYYIGGKEVSGEEFKQQTQDNQEGVEND